MFESLFAWVLNSYIGEYFGNVNTDQLSIALHNGEVELEGLPLREDAFKHLGLPLEIINGYIGKISLKIPVYRLKSEPWVISIDELFLIGRPITDFSYNEEEEKQNEQEFKLSQIDSMELRWKALHEAEKESQSYYASSYFSWINYGTSFISNIVENVQLKIRSVHIRYEDSSTIAGCPFAAGIIIKNLSVHSTDDNWVPKYVTRDNSEYIRKLVELQGFSAYWDTNTQLFSHLNSVEMIKLMRSHLDKSCDSNGLPTDHEYILAPVSGKAFLKRNCSEMPLKSHSMPRTVIDLQLEQVPVLLTAIQYKHIMEWSIAFNRANTAWKYRKWRPNLPIIGNSKLWWKFAVDSHMDSFRVKRRRRHWTFVLDRARDIVKYCDVYYVHLIHPESLTREMRQIKERIETQFSFEELCCVREIVFSKCDKSIKNTNNEQSNMNYWSFTSWLPNWYNSSDNKQDIESIDGNNESVEDLKPKNIDNSINRNHISLANVNIDDIFLTRDAVFGQLNFSIKNASFALMTFLDNPSSPTFTSDKLMNSLMEFEFSNVKIGVEIINTNLCNDDSNYFNVKFNENQKSHQLLNESVMQMNLLFECHSLNLVLLRTKSSIIHENEAYKLATASLHGCQITIKVGSNEIGIDGLLDGLQVHDLVTDPDNNKHKRVVSIGVINEYLSENIVEKPKVAQFGSYTDNSDNEKALFFSIRRLIGENILKVNIEMASLCYVHSNRLIYELTLCTQNLKTYMTVVTDKVKAAATEVALGIVTKSKSISNSRSKTSKDSNSVSAAFIEDFRLNIYLQTPVIILPTSPSSYEVMVSNLGHISLKNHISTDSHLLIKQRNHVIFAEIRDLSLYSLDCSKNIRKTNELSLTVEELYSCKPYGISILHETIIEITVEKKGFSPNFQFETRDECGLNSVNSVSDLIPVKKFSISSKTQNSTKELVLTIDIPNISLRVSYNDVLMFWHILNTLSPHSSYSSQNNTNNKNFSQLNGDIYAIPSSVKKLQMLGFIKEDCIKALNVCNGDISESAIWLTQNAKYKSKNITSDKSQENDINTNNYRTQNYSLFSKFSVIEVRIQNGILCLIDDCNETDVPLLEIKTKDFRLMQHNSIPIIEGFSQIAFSCDYFNSALSGWEPFVEHCKFQLSWNVIERQCHIKTLESPKKNISLHFELKEMLSVNITSNFAEMIIKVSKSWFDDIKSFLNMSTTKRAFRHRTPFIPYVIKNETGCKLKFYLVNDSQRKISAQENCFQNQSEINWISVEANETIPFSFDVSSKTRHIDSHLNKSHKIVVAVDGWKSVFPVTVNRVGLYFREANSERINETARIVFAINLEPKAKKLITIRSALLLSNKTSNAIELKFQNTTESVYINSGATLPVPLRLVRHKILVRPCDVGVNICETPIHWEHVRRCHEISSELQVCSPFSITRNQHSSYSTSSSYRFCVLVERNKFPLDISSQGPGLQSYRAQPAHTITLLPPLQFANLLPCELRFHISGTAVIGTIKSGEEISVHYVNPLKQFTIEFSMENFPHSKPLIINPGATRDYVTHLDMFDTQKRMLVLHAQLSLVSGSTSAVVISIYAPFWFMNRTGLPLIFKQDGASYESAGQQPEHEIARSNSPLLFSFSEHDSSHCVSVRFGKLKGFHPRWGNSFYLEKGTGVRRLTVGHNDPQKPDKVYELGIDVRNGRDRYRETRIVTITPRYQIENLSSYRLEFAQKFITTAESVEDENIISTLPKSNLAFHWPRTDRDKLLCVRIASIPNCFWSGGFAVEPSTSFHLNIRDEYSKSYFIRVEILIQSATYFIVFTDANNLPPPIRVENFSHVPIEFYQTKTSNSWMKTNIRPNTSVAYAWDESTLNPHITVRAPGGSSSTYDMNSLAPGDQLTYENFIYIIFTATFQEESDDEKVTVGSHWFKNDKRNELVFDVLEGSKMVFLARKERGKRSQLWRIDNSKRLIHEGSSPPLDPNDVKRASFHKTDKNALVLDIATNCALPGESMPLMLRKIDAKRALTQTWTFTYDGRLCCEHPNLFVQPKNGFIGLRAGNEIVLGPIHAKKFESIPNGIASEQAITTRKMRKGSGVLSVSVTADGPTRVLRICDVKNNSNARDKPSAVNSYLWKHDERDNGHKGFMKNMEFHIIFNVESIGLSIINQQNEELLHMYFQNSIFDFAFNLNEWNFNCSVQNIQIDNQLKGAEKSVVLHVSPQISGVPLPAISLTAQKLIVPNVEANVFKQLQISIKDVIFNLEEILLLKLLDFINYDLPDNELEQINNSENPAANRAISSILAKSSRYYFTIFLIQLSQVKLSVFTTSHLPIYLNELKKKLGIKLIRFEDATIQLLPFKRVYALMTKRFLLESIYEHYRAELKSQAAKILGSVDFLGNPLGFVNDVTDGINEFILEGNFGGLIWNVAHGISNSTAKVTSVLSESLGFVTMDERHQEIRKRIKQESNHHLSAGIRGLGVGLLGGVTSIISQTYDGAVKEGVSGLFFGLGRGLVGTIAYPAVGVLDFASGAASAVRDSSRKISSHHNCNVERVRPPRVNSIDGLLLKYQLNQAKGQQFFYNSNVINDREESEVFIALELLRHNFSALITSEKVRFFRTINHINYDEYKINLTIDFDNISKCLICSEKSGSSDSNQITDYYIIIVKINNYSNSENNFNSNTKLICDSELTAIKVCDQINYTKHSHEERKYFINPL